MEGGKLVEPVIVPNHEDEKKTFLEDATYKYFDILDHDINTILEHYHKLLGIPNPVLNPFSFACMHEQH